MLPQTVFLDGLSPQLPVLIERGTHLLDNKASVPINMPSGARFIGEGPATILWQTYHAEPIFSIDPRHNYLAVTGTGTTASYTFTVNFQPTDARDELWVFKNGVRLDPDDLSAFTFAQNPTTKQWTVTLPANLANAHTLKVQGAPFDIHGAGFENLTVYSPSTAPAAGSCLAFFGQTANCIMRNISCLNAPKLVRLGNSVGSASGFQTIASGMRLLGIRGTRSNSVHGLIECISGRGLITDAANDLHVFGVQNPNQDVHELLTATGDGTTTEYTVAKAFVDARSVNWLYSDQRMLRPYVGNVLVPTAFTVTDMGASWKVTLNTAPGVGVPVRIQGYLPIRTSTMATVAGCHMFEFGADTWDTAYIFGTYLGSDRGLYVNCAGGKFVGNIWVICAIFDFNKTNGMYFRSALGGNLGNIYIIEPYAVAWQGDGILFDGVGNLFNANVTGGKIAGAWEHGIHVKGPGTRQVRLFGVNGYGINRNVNANAAMVFVDANVQGVYVKSCGNQMEVFNQPYDYLPAWGIAIIGSVDHWQVTHNFFRGSLKNYNCETGSTASPNRLLADNDNADYAGYRDGADFTLANNGGGAFSWTHKRGEKVTVYLTMAKSGGSATVRLNGIDLFTTGALATSINCRAGDVLTVVNADSASAKFMAAA